MATARDDLPEDIDALKAVLFAERARAAQVEAALAVAKAQLSDDQALIAHQQLQTRSCDASSMASARNARRGSLTRWS